MSTTNNYALITGATRGIGYELAKLFVKDKYSLAIVARSQEELDRVAAEFRQEGAEVVTFAKDLFKREDAFSLCSEISRLGLEVNVLVNDAGQGAFGLFKDNDIERELDILDLNVAAMVIITKHFVHDMISRNQGMILNLGSIASAIPGPWHAVYHGTKAFVLSFSEALRSELKETNITVTVLMPGVTDTDFFNKADMTKSGIVQDKDAMSNPADVAKDGYDALMAGKDKIVSGFKNKMMVGMDNILPDPAMAAMMKKQHEPVDDTEQD